MSASIVGELVKKDLAIIKFLVLAWASLGVVALALLVFAGPAFGLASMILYITSLAGMGIHAVVQTVVEERREQTLAFIMSLPITVREYTSAKLIANLSVFVLVWLVMSAASFVIFIDGMPLGMLPMVVIILVGILLAYTVVLAVSLVTEAIGYAIGSIVTANLATQIYLWWVADLYGIRSVMGGDVPVWNATVASVLTVQLTAVVMLIGLTYLVQARKTDFI